MNKQEIIGLAEKHLLHTYNRFPVVLDHGDGVYLYDCEGKKYLDFAAGIAVFGLGYHNQEFDQAVKSQVDKLVHTSNLFYNEPAAAAAEKLAEAAGMDRVFFTNSGTEAVEGALKLARKYAYDRDGRTDHEIIAMNHSFHGRSMGALSVTGKAAYQDPFKPLIGGIRFAEYNDLDSVKALVTDKTCAVILETFQGEGGIYPAEERFLKGLRKLCDENDLLLILDEIQCGMGRTGKMFCFQHYGIRPDVLTVAKALGNGLPVGAFLCTEKAAALVPGDHGTTYGGNPLACAAAKKVLELFEKLRLPEHAKEVGEYLYERLEEVKARHACVKDHRGMGLLQGLELVPEQPAGEICQRVQKEGLILISASNNVIRFVPPLVIERQHVDEMAEKLERCLG